MANEVVTGSGAAYLPDEVVVALPHEGAVLDVLDRGRGTGRRPTAERDHVLGLARIHFDAAATSSGLTDLPEWADAQARLAARPAVRDQTTLDDALGRLRAVLATRWSGWTPTMGKNRLVASVEGGGRISGGVGGAGRISGGGGSDPVAAPRAAVLPAGGRPGRGVRVGVLDTGLSPRSRLAGCYARYSDLLLPSEDVSTRAGHATFIAGLVLSQAPGATVEVRRALDSDANGNSWSVARKIVEFGRDGLDVLNLSFLCFTEDDDPPLALSFAIDRLDPSTVVVAAAGNHGASGDLDPRRPAWPAALDDVVAVGAVDQDGRHASFSPPADVPWIDVRAPGVDLVSTFLDDVPLTGQNDHPGFAEWSGTSFSAALVSGAVAAATDPGRVPARDAWDDMRWALARTAAPADAAAQVVTGKPAPEVAAASLQPVVQLLVP